VLTSELLLHRYNGEELVPTRLPIDKKQRALAEEIIGIFALYVGKKRFELDEELSVLEGTDTDYRAKRGLAYLLLNGFCTFETVSPLEPMALRERVFKLSAARVPSPQTAALVIQTIADTLSQELGREVTTEQVKTGLYADLAENQILVSFETPTAEALLHRYNLSQVQGVLYRAMDLVLDHSQ
jgi:predicted nuclease of restriction endonuclease-like RecB superfamily